MEDHSDHAALAQYSMSVDSMQRVDAQVLDYCLMDNHDHFVLHTHRANRSRLMRRLNRVHTQAFNRRHRNVGHLFQGRFKAILVERDAYLWRCAVMWNSTRYAHKVSGPGEWPWSSYRAHVGEAHPPPWLDMGGLHWLLAVTAVHHGRPPPTRGGAVHGAERGLSPQSALTKGCPCVACFAARLP